MIRCSWTYQETSQGRAVSVKISQKIGVIPNCWCQSEWEWGLDPKRRKDALQISKELFYELSRCQTVLIACVHRRDHQVDQRGFGYHPHRDGHQVSQLCGKNPPGTVVADFLELLIFGVTIPQFEHFLHKEMTEKGLKKLGYSIEVSYSNIQLLEKCPDLAQVPFIITVNTRTSQVTEHSLLSQSVTSIFSSMGGDLNSQAQLSHLSAITSNWLPIL